MNLHRYRQIGILSGSRKPPPVVQTQISPMGQASFMSIDTNRIETETPGLVTSSLHQDGEKEKKRKRDMFSSNLNKTIKWLILERGA